MYTLQISLELVAIVKIVAASSPGGQWLPFRGKITDRNRENSIQNHPIMNLRASYLGVEGSNPRVGWDTDKVVRKSRMSFAVLNKPLRSFLILKSPKRGRESAKLKKQLLARLNTCEWCSPSCWSTCAWPPSATRWRGHRSAAGNRWSAVSRFRASPGTNNAF